MASNRSYTTGKRSESINRESEDLYQYLMFTFMMWNDVYSLDTLFKRLKLKTFPMISVVRIIRTDNSLTNGVLLNAEDKDRLRQCVRDFIYYYKNETNMLKGDRFHLLELAIIIQTHWNKGDMISYLMQTNYNENRKGYERTLKRCLDWAFEHRLYYTLHKMISSGDDLCLKHSLLQLLRHFRLSLLHELFLFV